MRPPPKAVGLATPPARRRDTHQCTGSWFRPPMRHETIGSGFRQRPAPLQKPVKKWPRRAALSRERAAGRTLGTAGAPRPPRGSGTGIILPAPGVQPLRNRVPALGGRKGLLCRHALVLLGHAVQYGQEPLVNEVQLVRRKVRSVRDLPTDLLQAGAVELGQGVRYGQSNEVGCAGARQVGRGTAPDSTTVCADWTANRAGLARVVAWGYPVHALTRFLAVVNQWPRHSFYRPLGHRDFARCTRGVGFPRFTSCTASQIYAN